MDAQGAVGPVREAFEPGRGLLHGHDGTDQPLDPGDALEQLTSGAMSYAYTTLAPERAAARAASCPMVPLPTIRTRLPATGVREMALRATAYGSTSAAVTPGRPRHGSAGGRS
ncbi:MAG: hypothetical protein ACOH16_01485 [Propionibacteriaceae bacterium]